jgi:hypothetical protein
MLIVEGSRSKLGKSKPWHDFAFENYLNELAPNPAYGRPLGRRCSYQLYLDDVGMRWET